MEQPGHLPEKLLHDRTDSSSLSDLLCRWLIDQHITELFLVPGAQVFPLVTAISRHPELNCTVAVHELGAAYMADGVARLSGHASACIAIGGPGASNLHTAASTAAIDDSPVLYITGSNPAAYDGQGAFQDGSKDAALFRTLIGNSEEIRSVAGMTDALPRIADHLLSHRPAHMHLPIDVQLQPATTAAPSASPLRPGADQEQAIARLDAACDMLAVAENPLVLAGHRVNTPVLRVMLQNVIERYQLPVVTTYGAKGLLPGNHELHLGNCGYAGTAGANAALFDSSVDLLLVIGADLNERNTLCQDPRIHPQGRQIIRIDTRSAPGINIDHDINVPDFAQALKSMNRNYPGRKDTATTRQKINSKEYAASPMLQNSLSVRKVLAIMQKALPPSAHLFVESGTLRIYAGQEWLAGEAGTFHSASGSAPMGWAIAAGIAAAKSLASVPVVILSGDGSMLMHGMELATAANHNLNVTVIVIDNGGQASNLRHLREGSRVGKCFHSPRVDWHQWAESIGSRGAKAETVESFQQALADATAYPGPSLISLATDPLEAFAYPDSTVSLNQPYLDAAGKLS